MRKILLLAIIVFTGVSFIGCKSDNNISKNSSEDTQYEFVDGKIYNDGPFSTFDTIEHNREVMEENRALFEAFASKINNEVAPALSEDYDYYAYYGLYGGTPCVYVEGYDKTFGTEELVIYYLDDIVELMGEEL